MQNESEQTAWDVEVAVDFYGGGKLLADEILLGTHVIRDGEWIRAMIPMTEENQKADLILVCLGFRGRYFFNKVEQQIQLVGTAMPEEERQMDEEPGFQFAAWGTKRANSMNRFVFGDAYRHVDA